MNSRLKISAARVGGFLKIDEPPDGYEDGV